MGTPTLDQWILIIGAVTGLGSAVFVGVNGMRSSKSTLNTSKVAIDARIDQRIDTEMKRLDNQVDEQNRLIEKQAGDIRQLRRDLGDAREKIAGLERTESGIRQENLAIKMAVKRWFEALKAWNKAGRKGPMPIPAEADMARMELHISEDTGSVPVLDS